MEKTTIPVYVTANVFKIHEAPATKIKLFRIASEFTPDMSEIIPDTILPMVFVMPEMTQTLNLGRFLQWFAFSFVAFVVS